MFINILNYNIIYIRKIFYFIVEFKKFEYLYIIIVLIYLFFFFINLVLNLGYFSDLSDFFFLFFDI